MSIYANLYIICQAWIYTQIFIGHGLNLQHLRYNSECDVYEELEPIDRNLQYDFNYQQITHLTREVTILPVRYHNSHGV